MKLAICSILFPAYDFTDITGCLKPDGHNDAHVCRTNTGKIIEWEDDYDCNCGCWNDEDGTVCMVYGEITENELERLIENKI